MQVTLNNESLQSAGETVNQLLESLGECEDKFDRMKGKIGFLSPSDVAKMLGCTVVTAREIFNRPDFPCCDYARQKMVFIPAFCEYFMKAVKNDDFIRGSGKRK